MYSFIAVSQNTYQPPKIITAGKPTVVSVPAKTEDSYTLQEKKISPPEVIPFAILKDVDGTPVKDKDGNTFVLGKGGIANFTNYTTENGLALDAIMSSCMDNFGNLWFGTDGNGVSRYDGKTFTNYTTENGLLANTVHCIYKDKKGYMWFGADNGVCCYNGISFVNYTTEQGLINNMVKSIYQDSKGTMWFGTQGGISRYDGHSFNNYTTTEGLVNNIVTGILEDKTGELWFGTYTGLSRYNGKSFTNYSVSDGTLKAITCIGIDKKGTIWCGTAGNGIYAYDGNKFTNYTVQQGLAHNIVLSMLTDSKGSIWFGTYYGITRYNGTTFTSFTTSQGLSSNLVLNILEDKAGNIWFSTYGQGICRFDGEVCTTYTTTQGLGNTLIISILEDKNKNIWLGTFNKGVSVYNNKSFINYTLSQGLHDNRIRCISEDKKGNIWLGHGKGISYFNGKQFINYTTLNKIVSYSIEDADGNMWFGTDDGVIRFDGNYFTTYTIDQGLADNAIECISEDKKGNLWFGTTNGVSFLEKKFLSASQPVFINYTSTQGLANNSVIAIFEDKKGTIWFGTDGGISRFDGKSFMNYTTMHDLPNNSITQITLLPGFSKNKETGLALGTNSGLAVLTGWKNNNDEFFSFEKLLDNTNRQIKSYTPVFEIYNSETGFPIKDVNVGQNAMYKDSKDILWIATGSEKTSLVRFDYHQLNRNSNVPTVVIQNIRIQEEKICWLNLKKNKNPADSIALLLNQYNTIGKIVPQSVLDNQYLKFSDIQFDSITDFYPLPEHLALPYTHNHISFEYAAIETSRPNMVKYRYILEGNDKEWCPVTDKTTALYSNLYEGTYTFRLKAGSPEGVWSEPVHYTFKVLPPWYRTWWMYAVYGSVVVAAVILIVYFNSRRLRAQKKILEEKVLLRTKQLSEKQKEIVDSIHYAKRIQSALLKDEEHLSPQLPEHFILFIPKDIISGDFYWALEKDHYWYVCAADCTGHGVPGAMMSMLGMAFLTEIAGVSTLPDPADILNELRYKIVKQLGQTGKSGENKDGMDISMIRINMQTKEVQWAGANNALYIVRNNELREIKANKQPIGYYEIMHPFSNHSIETQQGDMFYLFSDGYADQFGGSKGKKFKYKQLEELLVSISQKPAEEQKDTLRQAFLDWKGNTEQTDDVLVIGIRG